MNKITTEDIIKAYWMGVEHGTDIVHKGVPIPNKKFDKFLDKFSKIKHEQDD